MDTRLRQSRASATSFRSSTSRALACVPVTKPLVRAIAVRLGPVRAVTVSQSVGADVTGTLSSTDDPPVEAKVPWYKKPCPFKEISTVDELLSAISPKANGGRLTVVDFYAGWCACCKSAFPALCRLPNSEFLSQNYNFYKANIEEGDLANFIKRKGVRGIPHVLVFDSDGSHIIGMSGSFKKMDALRRNLDAIARTEPGSRHFVLDPEGMVTRR